MIERLAVATDVLYGGPVGSFVADRDAMAKELRSAGQKELAAAVKALRKPTVVADALNRALRADPTAVEALIEAALELRRAQEAMLAGERGDFGARQADYRGAVEAVVDRAGSHRDAVRSAVEAAAIGGLHTELSTAAFAVPPQPSGGFGPFELGPVDAAAPAGNRRSDKRSAKTKTKTETETETETETKAEAAAPEVEDELERKRVERAARRAAEEAVARAATDLQRAEQMLADADALVHSLDAAAVEVELELASLEARLVEARSARDEAVKVRTQVEVEVDDAADLVAAAKDTLKQLGRGRSRTR